MGCTYYITYRRGKVVRTIGLQEAGSAVPLRSVDGSMEWRRLTERVVAFARLSLPIACITRHAPIVECNAADQTDPWPQHSHNLPTPPRPPYPIHRARWLSLRTLLRNLGII